MNELQKILGKMRQAVDHYGMISPGDKIAVGLSGGKDSLALLMGLHGLSRFYPHPFTVCAVTVSIGFPEQTRADFSEMERLCCEMWIEYRVEETEIATIVFDERKEKNPCSLCSKLRRGALCGAAEKMGANKLALGHHKDDVVETFMLNLLQTGRIGCFMPVTQYDDTQLTVIRPLIYTEEGDIRKMTSKMGLPVYKNPCPADGKTERVNIRAYLGSFDKERRGLYRRILGALERSGIDGWKE